MAMSKLETMYNSWTWELRSHVQRLQDQLINQIQNGKIQTLGSRVREWKNGSSLWHYCSETEA